MLNHSASDRDTSGGDHEGQLLCHALQIARVSVGTVETYNNSSVCSWRPVMGGLSVPAGQPVAL